MKLKKWKTVTIDLSPIEIIDGDRGRNYPKQEEFYDNEYCLFLNTSNVTSQGFNFEKTSFVTKKKDQELRKGKLNRDDIVLTTRGTVGNVAYYDKNVLYNNIRINSGMVIFRNSSPDEISSQYFYQFLRSPLFRIQVESHSSGSAQPQLPIKDLKKIELPLPTLPTQTRIAAILSALDDKIGLNRETNATLEAIAQAIFKEWFVNFRYPGATGAMQDSKLGNIPKAWLIRKLGDVVEIQGGTTPSTKNPEYWGGEYAWSTPRDLSNLQSPVLLDTERKISNKGVQQISSGILPKGTLLLSSRAPIGYLAITQLPVSINQGYIAIQGRLVSNLFMLFWLSANMGTIKERANGSTFQEISKSNFREIDIILPSTGALNDFEASTEPLFNQIVKNEIENKLLSQLRDNLLPKLMSGEIEV